MDNVNTDLAFKFDWMAFKNEPSEYTALAVFLSARKCGKEIPDKILEAITPCIQRLYNEKHELLLTRLEKKNEKYYNNRLLLLLALWICG